MSAGRNPEFDPRLLSRFKLLTLDELALLEPPAWLVEGYLPEDGTIVLYGEPGGGKTFIALDWTLSIATGTPWLKRGAQPGAVVYIYAEGARGIAQRCDAWFKEHGLTAAPGFRPVACPVNLLDMKEVGTLVQAILTAEVKPRLIVIDTLARCFGGGDENQTRDMNAFVAGCDHLRRFFPGASVLIVHHTGKNAEKGARGSIALKGAADAEFLVTKTKSGTIRLRNTKQKDSEPAADLPLRLVPVGESCAIRAADAAEAARAEEEVKAPRGKNTEDAVFFALLSLGLEGASYTAWLTASGEKKATFDRHRDKLVAAGRVKKWRELYYCVVSLDDIPDAEDGYYDDTTEEANHEH
jgi:hypothetical protein